MSNIYFINEADTSVRCVVLTTIACILWTSTGWWVIRTTVNYTALYVDHLFRQNIDVTLSIVVYLVIWVLLFERFHGPFCKFVNFAMMLRGFPSVLCRSRCTFWKLISALLEMFNTVCRKCLSTVSVFSFSMSVCCIPLKIQLYFIECD